MNEQASTHERPSRSILAIAAICIAGAAVIGALLSGLGSRWGLWGFGAGFQVLRWAAYAGIAAAALSLVAMIFSRPGTSRRGFGIALLALVLGLAVAAVPWSWQRTAREAPPIHDITTDTEDPPRFAAIRPLRADAPNATEYGGAEVATQQREAYPEIRPIRLAVPVDEAFRRALAAARDMGWEIVAADSAAGRIEGTATTFWFGFKDDVVIRVRPVADGTRVDVRSVSRVGRGDVGTNARRIEEYAERLRDVGSG